MYRRSTAQLVLLIKYVQRMDKLLFQLTNVREQYAGQLPTTPVKGHHSKAVQMTAEPSGLPLWQVPLRSAGGQGLLRPHQRWADKHAAAR